MESSPAPESAAAPTAELPPGIPATNGARATSKGLTATPHLDAKLAKLWWEPPEITKRSDAKYGKYANLLTVMTALRPVLRDLGMGWRTWPLRLEDGTFVLRWKITDLESGECESGDYPIYATTPQGIGSEITYACRYSLVAVTGVIAEEAEDDDGEGAPKAPRRTRAKVPGADHERLVSDNVRGAVPGVRRTRAGESPDPGGDPWLDQPAGKLPEPPEDQPGSISRAQLTRLHAGFEKLGMDRDVRMTTIAEVVGRPVGSSTDLSLTEGQKVLAWLSANPRPVQDVPLPGPAVEDIPMVSPAQRALVFAGLRRMGLGKDEAATMAQVSAWVGREVKKTSELNAAEAQVCLDRIAEATREAQ